MVKYYADIANNNKIDYASGGISKGILTLICAYVALIASLHDEHI